MAGGRQIDEAGTGLEQRHDAVDEDEMAEMVGAELQLEAIGGEAFRRRHHAGIGNDEIEFLALLHQRIGRRPYAAERRQIQLDQLEAAGLFRPDAFRRPLGLLQIARRPDDMSAMGFQRPRRLDAQASRNAGHQNPLAGEIETIKNLVGGRFRVKRVCHPLLQIQGYRLGPAAPCLNGNKWVRGGA